MTPEQQAARWLADVPRLESWSGNPVIWEADALVAIARHLAPGDDLKLIADCELAAKVMADAGTFETGQSILREAAARISALTATVAELEATVAEVTSDRAYIIGANAGWDEAVAQGEASPAVKSAMVRFWQKMAERHQTEAATLRDRLARIEAAATRIRGLTKYDLNPKSCEITASEDGEFVVYDHVSAALTNGGSNG